MTQIIPAIIPKSFEEIQEKMGLVKGLAKELVSKVQIDVEDGKYTPFTSWPFLDYKNKKEFPFKYELVVEVDMMVRGPEDYIEDFIKMGARSFVVHVDSTHYLDKCIHMVREAGCQFGLGIRPRIDSKILEEYLDRVDFVQFMGSDEEGQNGVELDRRVLDKIYHFHSGHPYIDIQVDIGVNERTAPELKRVGVSDLVSGSAIFSEGDIKENISKLKDI